MKLKIDPLTPKHINPQHVIMFQSRKLDGATAQPPYEDITLRFSTDFGNSSY